MTRRTLQEAIDIAAGHRTPADNLEMRLRQERVDEKAWQRHKELEHEIAGILGVQECPPGIVTNTVGAAVGVTVAGPGQHENDILKRIQSVLGGQVTGLSASNGRADSIVFAKGSSVPIPEWANWLAVDESGLVRVCSHAPSICPGEAYTWYMLQNDQGKSFSALTSIGYRPNWRETLCPLTAKAWKEWSK